LFGFRCVLARSLGVEHVAALGPAIASPSY
jgi:hypothetical protein